MSKDLVLISCSGGMDSSCSLMMTQLAGFQNIVACHFLYSARGQESEELAITTICKKLNITLKVFDLGNIYKQLDSESISMLQNKNAPITTGTSDGLKTVHAWHPGRNMLFMTILASFAEAEVMKNNYDNVYIMGGWLQLTESGTYPDNSEAFTNSCFNMFKFGTLIGNRLKPLYGLCDLMKSDQMYLIKYFNLFDIYKHTISCDRPFIDLDERGDKIACNCSKNGKPACGSGALSYWAGKMVGMNDMELRHFYPVNDKEYELYEPSHLKENKILEKNIHNIIDRIHFSEDHLNVLRKKIELKIY